MIGGAGTLKVRFGRCVLDLDRLELRNGDNPVSLEPQVFSLLVYLLQNRDRVVSRDEIVDAVWNGRIVSEGTLNTRISGVRRAGVPNGTTQQVIKTYPRRGFRFVGSTIVYAFLQATGLVNDHVVGCFRCRPCAKLAKKKFQ